jgi:carboxylesterase
VASSKPSTFIQNESLPGGTFEWIAGPTGILLVHGFTATTAEVRLLAQFLHEQGFTVSAPLLPGHGTSPEDLNHCRWNDWTDAVARAYQSLVGRCEQVVVGGQSMGGLLAIHLAAHHPEISGLMLYAPALEALSPFNQFLVRLAALFVPIQEKPAVAPSLADSRWKGYTVYPLAATVQLFNLQAQAKRCLPLLRRPILIIQGRNDQRLDPSGPEKILSSVQSNVKELHWLPKSGHVVLLDQEWDQAANLSLDFLHRILN